MPGSTVCEEGWQGHALPSLIAQSVWGWSGESFALPGPSAQFDSKQGLCYNLEP